MPVSDSDNPRRLDLERAARRYLAGTGIPDADLQPLYLQPDRAVYLAASSDIVVKVYAEHDLLRRDWECTRLARAAGLPTAEPLAFDPGPPASFAMRRVLGRSLEARDTTAVREAGAFLARFHRLDTAPPFTSGGVRWEDHIGAVVEWALAELGRRDVFNAAFLARLRRYFGAQHGRLTRRPIGLLHGDLQPAHVLVAGQGEEVVAFLDFADAQPGDPLFDIAVLTLWDDCVVAPLLAGYATIPDDAETRELLAAYRLLRHLSSIPWLLDRDFDRFAEQSIAAATAMLS